MGPIEMPRKVFIRCMGVPELLSIAISVISLAGSTIAVLLALNRPGWLREQERRILMLETEWEEVLDKIKKRGDRLSRERGLISKMTPAETSSVPTMTRRAQIWKMKREKEANSRA